MDGSFDTIQALRNSVADGPVEIARVPNPTRVPVSQLRWPPMTGDEERRPASSPRPRVRSEEAGQSSTWLLAFPRDSESPPQSTPIVSDVDEGARSLRVGPARAGSSRVRRVSRDRGTGPGPEGALAALPSAR